MGTVEEYRERREARKAERKRERIADYRERRAIRLLERGLMPVEYRMDAPDENGNNNNNNKGGGDSGGHGNTRLPFGLCMRYGITIEPGWGPGDAWEALKGVGVEAKRAYEKLKAGVDPGTPEPEPPKDPVKTIRVGRTGREADYNKLEGKKISWASRGEAPWRLYGDRVEGSYEDVGWRSPSKRMSEPFYTKTDMLHWLKEKGVEEFPDPETGELLNPKEMELPNPVFKDGRRGFTDISIGLRDGKYTVIGTDYDGKKKKLAERSSLASAKSYCEAGGAKEEDIKMSPAMKKREKERLSWLSSDKKEYFESGGEKYGDVHIEPAYRGFTVIGEAEDGRKIKGEYATKAEAMKFLKDQGVEVAREGKTAINPMEYEIPETKATIEGRPYSDVGMKIDKWGDVRLYGKDLDGGDATFTYKRSSETLGAFKERIAERYGLNESDLTISDEDREKFAEMERAEAEKERRRKEFEQKAIELPSGKKYADIELIAEDYGDEYKMVGYDRDGVLRDVTYSGDFYEMEQKAKEYGLDISTLMKKEEVQKEYQDYKQKMSEFESKAIDFAGDKYADVHTEWDKWDGYTLYGTDYRGRKREIGSSNSYEDYEKLLEQYGHTPDSFPMDSESQKKKEKAMKVKYALATGEYYSLGEKDAAYKDIRIVQEDGDTWSVIGTDVDGAPQIVKVMDSWDDAIEAMNSYGISDYKIKDRDGEELSKPKWGMRKVMLMRKPEGGYLVFADSKRYGEHAIMYETPSEDEAKRWLRENGVPDSAYRTRGMNPNDDVPRTHTAKSLDGFDKHRAEKADEYGVLKDMDEATKVETAEMLTEMFDKGAFRMRRKDHFEEVFDGHFKGLLETGTSSGSDYKPGRRETGVKTFGHDYDIKPSDSEKYGYWGIEDEAEAVKASPAKGYGSTVFKFKKDKVGDRVTYTFGDTLDAGRPLAGYAGSKPTIEGVTGLDEWGSGTEKLRAILDDYRAYKRGDMSWNDFYKTTSRSCQDGYVEIQYHGKLTLDDVASISFPEEGSYRNPGIGDTFKKMTPEKRQKVVTYLKERGIILQYYDYDGVLHNGYDYLEKRFGVK